MIKFCLFKFLSFKFRDFEHEAVTTWTSTINQSEHFNTQAFNIFMQFTYCVFLAHWLANYSSLFAISFMCISYQQLFFLHSCSTTFIMWAFLSFDPFTNLFSEHAVIMSVARQSLFGTQKKGSMILTFFTMIFILNFTFWNTWLLNLLWNLIFK
jgi:hypothetical protein